MTNRSPIEIYTLGPFRVAVDGVPMDATAWRSKKAQMLFKYLLTQRGKKVPRDVLLELLWPEEEPDVAAGRLYTTLHLLRRAVEPDLPRYGESTVVTSGGGMYWCDIGPALWVDSEVFAHLYDRATAAEQQSPAKAWSLWQQCLSLYAGNYLEEDPYEDWAVLTREMLLDRFVDGSLRAARIHYELTDDPETSIQLCLDALQHDRFREELYQALISYLIAANRHSEAALQYRNLSGMLRDEFALEPSQETQDLLKREGIDPLHASAHKSAPISKLIERLPVADASPTPPEEDSSGPLLVEPSTFAALRTWNERLSARYLTSFSVLRLGGPHDVTDVVDDVFDEIGGQLRSSDVITRDGDRVYVLLPYMERRGANVVARRLQAVVDGFPGLRFTVEVQVYGGRDLALVSHG